MFSYAGQSHFAVYIKLASQYINFNVNISCYGLSAFCVLFIARHDTQMVWMLIKCLKQKAEKQPFHIPELSSWLKPHHYEVWWVSYFKAKSPSFMTEQTRRLIALYCPGNFPWRIQSRKVFGFNSQDVNQDSKSFAEMEHYQPIKHLKQFSYTEQVLSWSGQCWLAGMNPASNCAGTNCVVEVHLDLRYYECIFPVVSSVRVEYRLNPKQQGKRQKKGAYAKVNIREEGREREREILMEMIGRQNIRH